MNALSPIVSEFASEAEAKAYDDWFRAKVAESLADATPPVTHQEVMAGVQKIIDDRKKT